MTNPDGEYVFPGGHRFAATRATIVGPTSGSVRAICRGPTRVFGFGMLPAGWATLMGDDADKLTDRALDAMQLFGSWMDEVIKALEGAADDAERLIAANNFVREIMKRNHPAPLWFIRIADRWLTESASPQVADLVAATGMSIRSEEHTSELPSLMRISYAVFCLKKKKKQSR